MAGVAVFAVSLIYGMREWGYTCLRRALFVIELFYYRAIFFFFSITYRGLVRLSHNKASRGHHIPRSLTTIVVPVASASLAGEP